MRRVVIFAALLSLLGLSTAFAASFSVQSEDIASFTTDVSISVPNPNPTALPDLIYVRGMEDDPSGTLDLTAPVGNDSTQKRLVRLDSLSVLQQADVERYFTWISPTAPANGYRLQGTVTLEINQTGPAASLMTAGLLVCPSLAPISSTTCTEVDVAVSNPGGSGNGNHERTIPFGPVNVVIPANHQLRLKIVNRTQQPPGTTVSTADWSISWGYLPSRQSRLVTTHP